ncbi:thiosulfate oxidation carrier protein SoxY [Sulfuricystis multivorans]|uniref:thiosulfate oxidation carrier protein SoxY n=1 Tax=Sulfuricystis multivorans TaxID=2211108 RepID=UPI000F819C35|nr:thiosulfate oxidation carrier protein SoxY [Sulfuricystis multivorans]
MDLIRRTVLKGAGATGVLAGLLATGMLKPTLAYANEWNAAAFGAKDLDVALKTIGADGASANASLVMKAPDIAENGAVVPVDVVSNIPNTSSIAILVKKNPFPLAAYFEFSNGALPDVSIRLKVAETCPIIAIAKADGKTFSTQKEVKVTVGGCGG